ncbi:hypothetical protein PoB_004611800 [Plakobranchus ocellatus]|uniref:Uncharacterized protein n=1 Tax=Plakobranchus ocellatus TaxID=259542 RepID=A0AAV4BJ58_9GAST|nr:hypothetical protein PoB_004611800 [Plakobranchus ocellatus]
MSGRRRNTKNKQEVQSGQICLNGQAMAVRSNGSGGQSKSADVIATRNNRILPDISLRISTSSPTSETSAVDQVMDINRRLLTQIETLRLKVDIDKRHQEASRAEVKADTEAKFKAKNSQLRELKNDLKDKEEVLQVKMVQSSNKMKF